MNVHNKLETLPQIEPSQTTLNIVQAKNTASKQEVTTSADHTSVSTTASQIALSIATSDVRLEKVAGIQNALQAGTYGVPSSAVAQKMTESMLIKGK